MEQIRNSDLIEGKTIERTDYLENKLFLFFTDNTFCIISGCGWDERDVEFNEDEFELLPTISNYRDLKKLGLITQETFLEFQKKEVERNAERERKRDIDKLNELRKRYPDA